MREFYVHATDGHGLYAGMQLVVAASKDEAIEQARATWKDIPASCTTWFASSERKYVNSCKPRGRR